MISRRHLATLFLSALSVVALAGCGSEAGSGSNGGASGTATGNAQSITITAKDDLFDPATYTAEAGKPMRITLTNAGQNIHVVEVKDLFPETQLAPGQTKTIDVASATAGTYRLYCETHENMGTEGEFVVK